jgi:hypothetical protein
VCVTKCRCHDLHPRASSERISKSPLTRTWYCFPLMPARDTTSSAAELQDHIHRQFSPADRLRMAIEMSEFARSLTRAALRNRQPELTESELEQELLVQLYGFRPTRK